MSGLRNLSKSLLSGVEFKPHCGVQLSYELVAATRDLTAYTVEFGVRLWRTEDGKTAESDEASFDTVFSLDELPAVEKNDTYWQRVRSLMIEDGYDFIEAYLSVCADVLLEKWNLEIRPDEPDVKFTIQHSPLKVLEVVVPSTVAGKYVKVLEYEDD